MAAQGEVAAAKGDFDRVSQGRKSLQANRCAGQKPQFKKPIPGIIGKLEPGDCGQLPGLQRGERHEIGEHGQAALGRAVNGSTQIESASLELSPSRTLHT
jgi:hypothetical protein